MLLLVLLLLLKVCFLLVVRRASEPRSLCPCYVSCMTFFLLNFVV